MKKLFKRKICVLLLLVLALSIFSGCDSDKSEKESDSEETTFDFSDFAWTGEPIQLPFLPFDTSEGESSQE